MRLFIKNAKIFSKTLSKHCKLWFFIGKQRVVSTSFPPVYHIDTFFTAPLLL